MEVSAPVFQFHVSDGFHGDLDGFSTHKDSFSHISELENTDIPVEAPNCIMLANVDGMSMKSMLAHQTRNLSLVSAGLVTELVEGNSDIAGSFRVQQ